MGSPAAGITLTLLANAKLNSLATPEDSDEWQHQRTMTMFDDLMQVREKGYHRRDEEPKHPVRGSTLLELRG